MKPKTKKFLETELENILLIHFDAKYYFEDVEYLSNPDTNEERIASNNVFVRRIRKAFWRLGIIEIAKLFQKSKNQHYNLLNYLEELINNYENYTWIQNLPKKNLQDWQTKLNSKRIKNIRNNISIQRNKYFAHTNRNPSRKFENVLLEFIEITELLKLTELIIFEIKINCLSVHPDFEVTGMEKAGNILNAYVALREKKENEMKQEWDKFIKEKKTKK